ncbi:MAG: hypothetical protein JWO03_2946 [Bacteroidetes bacterium]|nr:hypothetical protein [Bacteroidota bacterium]
MKKAVTLVSFFFSFTYLQAQNVGIGTNSPGTKLDVSGAITLRETSVAIAANAATIPSNVSQVRVTGAATATVTLAAPAAPPNAGQALIIYNNTTGGFGATYSGTTIPAGTALEFVYSNSAWVPTSSPSAGSGSYIQNQKTAIQAGDYRISGGAYVGGNDTVAGSQLISGNLGIGTPTVPTAAQQLYQDRYTLYGPNSTWTSLLRVGGNGGSIDNLASVATTNGNLHLDASSVGPGTAMYLNYYKGNGGINFGNGAGAVIGTIDNTGYLSMNNAINSGVGFRVGGAAPSGQYMRGNGTNFVSSAIQPGDLPTGGTGYIQNQTAADQSAGFRINGKGDINNGSPFAVPNGYMANGSLTIGGITAGYGGGSGWTANTAGLLMETNGPTEIAIHHSGARVASAMYYTGNTITVGRDMGWGTLASETHYGSIGIGAAPSEALSVTKPMAGWQSHFANANSPGSDVYLAHGGGYGMHIRGYTASDGIYALQIYNNTSEIAAFWESGRTIFGQVGNVGIGTTTPNGKLDVYNTAANGDGMVMAADITMDNNFTLQSYIDAGIGGGGWAGRTTYAGACCNNIALNPDAGTVSVGGVSSNYGSNKFNVIGNAYISGNLGIGTTGPARKLEVNNAMKFTNGSTDANDGVLGTAPFAVGLNIVGINTDGGGRKVNWWGSFLQNENPVGNNFIGTTTIATLYHGLGSYSVSGYLNGIMQTASTADGHQYLPLTGNWGYLGTSGQYWYYSYAASHVNMSQRKMKRDITPLNTAMYDYVMNDIDKIKPSFYKTKDETDELQSGNEAKYRPNMHLGVILDESPDYLQDQAFSGIDIYAMATLGVAGVKYNREEIKQLKEAVGISKNKMTISDFGSEVSTGAETWVMLSDEFMSKNKGAVIPVVTVTSTIPGVSLSVTETKADRFKVVRSGDAPAAAFNWIAMAKVDLKQDTKTEDQTLSPALASQLKVDESKKAAMREFWKQQMEHNQAEATKAAAAPKNTVISTGPSAPKKDEEVKPGISYPKK